MPTLKEIKPSAAESNPFADEGFNLKAEDLVLDLQRPQANSSDESFLTLFEEDSAEEKTPTLAVEASSPAQSAPVTPEPAPSISLPLETAPPATASENLNYILEVARVYLGPLGPSLLKKEAAPLSLRDRDWPEAQLRELVLRFCRSAQWILGQQQSQRLLEKIREKVRV